MMKTIRCPRCSSMIDDQQLYCPVCGKQLITAEEALERLNKYESIYSTMQNHSLADLYRIAGKNQEAEALIKAEIDDIVFKLSDNLEEIDENTLCILADYYLSQNELNVAYELYLAASKHNSDYAFKHLQILNEQLKN